MHGAKQSNTRLKRKKTAVQILLPLEIPLIQVDYKFLQLGYHQVPQTRYGLVI